MAEYFDAEGQYIKYANYAELLAHPHYQYQRKTRCNNGCIIETVWIGEPHGYGPQGPLIFRTIVSFPNLLIDEAYYYATREEAVRHHQHLCNFSR